MNLDDAVRSNARWCDAVCRAHGVAGEWTDDVWLAGAPTPEDYPDAVTLVPGAKVDLAGLRSIKDSYADLEPPGFEVLFEATWLTWPGGKASPDLEIVTDASGLIAWEAGWGGPTGTFTEALLASVEVRAARRGDRIVAGAIVHDHDLSNVFTPDRESRWWSTLAGATPLVGYERGADLDAALRAGFEPLGPLRVWVKR